MQGEFAIKKLPKKQTLKYKANGHMTKNNFVFVDKEGYSRVYFGKEKLTKSKKGKKKEEFFTKSHEFLTTIEQKILENENVPGKTVMYKIGNNRTLSSRTATYADFQQYLKNTFDTQLTQLQKEHMKHLSPKKRAAYKKKILDNNEYVMNNISIVTISRKTTKKKTTKKKGKKKKKKLTR